MWIWQSIFFEKEHFDRIFKSFFQCKYIFKEHKTYSRFTLRYLASHMWPVGRTLPRHVFKSLKSIIYEKYMSHRKALTWQRLGKWLCTGFERLSEIYLQLQKQWKLWADIGNDTFSETFSIPFLKTHILLWSVVIVLFCFVDSDELIFVCNYTHHPWEMTFYWKRSSNPQTHLGICNTPQIDSMQFVIKYWFLFS